MLRPTKLYVKSCLAAAKTKKVEPQPISVFMCRRL